MGTPTPGRLCIRDAQLAGGALDAATELLGAQPLQELDVELSSGLAGSLLMVRLSEWLGRVCVASRTTLRSLRLSGPLHLGAIFHSIAPHAAHFMQLEQVMLARGAGEWQPAVAAAALHRMPCLRRVQFRYSFDDEDASSQDLVGVLLQGPGGAPLPAVAGMPGPPILRSLQHLALVFPPRSVIPPTAHLPEALSTMTQLTALKFKRYPVLSVPTWLGALTNLRYLLWDPALPADTEYTMPPGLGSLTNLEFIWVVHQVPLILPNSLAGTLRGLHVMARGFNEDRRWLQHWGWLQGFSKLESMRLQGVGLEELPCELLHKSALTRLDLMCNGLEELPEGPYLSSLRCMHLGNNRLQRFPSALLRARQLEIVNLTNQAASDRSGSSGRSSPCSSPSSTCSSARLGAGATQRMVVTEADVQGLLQLHNLREIVMNNMQPQVLVGLQRHDFTWLQRALKQRNVRLTSNELAYSLQSKEVFDIRPLRETEESASSMDSTSCHGEPAAQAADSLSSSRALPPRAASGEHRSEHKSSRRRSFHFPFGF